MNLAGFLFLLVPFLLPVILIYINKSFFNNKFTTKNIAFFSALIWFIFLVSTIFLIKYQIEMELNSFDLNKDGSFSDEECTPACEQAMSNFTNDTGSNFGLFFSPLWATLYYGILLLINNILSRIKNIINQK